MSNPLVALSGSEEMKGTTTSSHVEKSHNSFCDFPTRIRGMTPSNGATQASKNYTTRLLRPTPKCGTQHHDTYTTCRAPAISIKIVYKLEIAKKREDTGTAIKTRFSAQRDLRPSLQSRRNREATKYTIAATLLVCSHLYYSTRTTRRYRGQPRS